MTALAERPKDSPLAPRDSLRVLLERSQDQILKALPKHIGPAYFVRVVMTVVQRTPKLLECDPMSFLGAVFQCAQLGLVPDPQLRQAYFVPFLNNKRTPPRLEVQFIPGYAGLIDLVRRSGELSTIDADVVHAKDHFVYARGFQPTFEHVPSEDADPGEVVKAYAWLKLKDGSYQLKVMNRREIDAIRKRSKASSSGPWVTDFDWMAKKTVLKQLCKLAPMSIETHAAIALDERHEIGLPQDLAMLADPHATATVVEDEATGDIIDTATGEVTMPQRVSAPAVVTGTTGFVTGLSVAPPTSNSQHPNAAAAPTPMPEGADRIADVLKRESTQKPGTYFWDVLTTRGVRGYTWSTTVAADLERFKRSSEFVEVRVEQDGRSKFKVLGVKAFVVEPWGMDG